MFSGPDNGRAWGGPGVKRIREGEEEEEEEEEEVALGGGGGGGGGCARRTRGRTRGRRSSKEGEEEVAQRSCKGEEVGRRCARGKCISCKDEQEITRRLCGGRTRWEEIAHAGLGGQKRTHEEEEVGQGGGAGGGQRRGGRRSRNGEEKVPTPCARGKCRSRKDREEVARGGGGRGRGRSRLHNGDRLQEVVGEGEGRRGGIPDGGMEMEKERGRRCEWVMDALYVGLERRQIPTSLAHGHQRWCICLLALGVITGYHLLTSSAAAFRLSAHPPPATSRRPNGEGPEFCSRAQSRVARSILSEYLLPVVEKEWAYAFSEKCLLNPARDMFHMQEGNKSGSNRMDWKCLYCGKGFYAEVYIDKHMDNRHKDKVVNGGVCLGDMCDVLHCNEWEANKDGATVRGKCQSQVMEKRYHRCQSIALSCFPLDGGPASARLNEFFMRQFCAAHTCDSRRKLFSEGRTVKSSSSWLTFKIISVFGLLVVFYGCFYACNKGVVKQALTSRPSRKSSSLKSKGE
ncbi:hypothetical protein CBR_g52069 [Chara braunii]|uniref:C2H2-type domain-containing protein n=1 Tax=Chara braunii TaxID=69332 RepID=A0A388M9C2_CHABU|nr:hypothetical protein CBR_g52069 [Chara braunii]|eukprot:GBG91187.1 hypothetical protein CBR_g52069 [Chara braunii]